METHEIIAKFIVVLLSSFLFIGMAILILLFLGITLSIFLGDYFGKIIYGFGSISVLYVIIFLILILFRKRLIEKPVMDHTIKELNRTEKDENEKEEK